MAKMRGIAALSWEMRRFVNLNMERVNFLGGPGRPYKIILTNFNVIFLNE